jgi:hypothetical protein
MAVFVGTKFYSSLKVAFGKNSINGNRFILLKVIKHSGFPLHLKPDKFK